MKLHFAVIGVVFAIATVSDGAFVPYKTAVFNQKIDHFVYSAASGKGFKNNPRFPQRYLYTDKFFDKAKGPIFFYTGNEGPIEGFWNNTGFVHEIAPKFGALVVFAEHRYYGQSLPFGNDSFKQENLQYLTIEQAMADFAVLIHVLRNYVFNIPDRPVIAFGGSYGGMLTQYMRFKYPNLIEGGIVGSAPFYWIANITDTHPETFFADITNVYAGANAKCPTIVRSGFARVRSLVESGQSGMQQVSKAFNLCKPIQNQTDVRQLYGWARNAFVLMAMGDYPYPTEFMAPLPAWPVNASCSAMLKAGDSVSALKAAVEFVYQLPAGQCHDIYQEYVFCADPTGCGTGPESLAWDFQACTEMHLPYGSDNVTDMFPPLAFTPESLVAYCKDKYNVETDVEWLGVLMWGDRIHTASNLVFSNGDLDPWHNGGLLKSIPNSKDLVAVRIPNGAHHLDLRGSNPADPPDVIRARQTHVSYIKKWLTNYENRQGRANPASVGEQHELMEERQLDSYLHYGQFDRL
ncbi:hypothetical protein BOX15_Mlig022232g3 [Macrostomum lignano]|uniref:Lysosomal Pro-X carboxypeptidase n=2 Tax=Macrostomum lignano TaxID=282301 RepID=A0A1I8GD54_9PLAT|nr:hypothetical protein BOX15_Mlig022232g3 [Macrostomum lignano]